MSSLSSSSKSSLHSHSSSTRSKLKFIWRFPSSKFDNLPSCTSKRLSSIDIQPLNIDDELIQRQQLSILIYELASHLNVYAITIPLKSSIISIPLDHLRVSIRVLFICIDSLCYIHFNNVLKKYKQSCFGYDRYLVCCSR
jgi:hypothetical protein